MGNRRSHRFIEVLTTVAIVDRAVHIGQSQVSVCVDKVVLQSSKTLVTKLFTFLEYLCRIYCTNSNSKSIDFL